jgi:hypothetical protein
MLDRSGDAQLRVARAVERGEVAADVGVGEPRDVRARPDDPLTEGMPAEHQPAGDVVGVDLDVVLVVVLVDLLEDQGALELDIGESGPAHQLAEEPHRGGDVLHLEAELEQRVVAAGLGVELGAELLHGGVERERRGVLLGAPEQHVLDEVGQAVVGGRLEPRADLDEQGHDGRVEVGQGDCGHVEPVVEASRFDAGVEPVGARGPGFH